MFGGRHHDHAMAGTREADGPPEVPWWWTLPLMLLWGYLFMGPLAHLGFWWAAGSFVVVWGVGAWVVTRRWGWERARRN